MRDHPRSRGEYLSRQTPVPGSYGSSPLSRGILLCEQGFSLGEGIIPALAGNTQPTAPEAAQSTDHPRSRGEYNRRGTPHGCRSGSSPLSRGIHVGLLAGGECRGIIPALAGNTLSGSPSSAVGRDHPRSRGEYPFCRLIGVYVGWIIPALAGNTSTGCIRGHGSGDHPRSRGEYPPTR